MKRLIPFLLLLVSLSSFGQTDTTKYYSTKDYGWKWPRGYFQLALTLPSDTVGNKVPRSVAVIGSTLYIKGATGWAPLSGGGSATDTSFLSARINERVRYSDTAAMLAPYLRAANLPAPATPGLSDVLTESNDAGRQKIANSGGVRFYDADAETETVEVGAEGGNGLVFKYLPTGNYSLFAFSSLPGPNVYEFAEGGVITTREWVNAQNYATSAQVTSRVASTDTAAMLAPYLRTAAAAATYQPKGTYLTAIDSTTYGTRAYVKKVGDSTYQRAASAFVPQTTTITAGNGLSGGGPLSGNLTISADTLTLSTKAARKKLADSLAAVSAATYQPLNARYTKAVFTSGYTSATVAASSTLYNSITGQQNGGFTSEGSRRQITTAGVLRTLTVTTFSAQPASGSLVITVRVNGVSTALTLTLAAGAAAGVFQNTSNSVTVNAGDIVTYQFINNATAASAAIDGIAMELTNN